MRDASSTGPALKLHLGPSSCAAALTTPRPRPPLVVGRPGALSLDASASNRAPFRRSPAFDRLRISMGGGGGDRGGARAALVARAASSRALFQKAGTMPAAAPRRAATAPKSRGVGARGAVINAHGHRRQGVRLGLGRRGLALGTAGAGAPWWSPHHRRRPVDSATSLLW